MIDPYNRGRVLTIDDLPDDDLLAIFDFYVVRYQDLAIREYTDYSFHVVGYRDLSIRKYTDYNTKRKIESWQSLVHVCRRWRCLVFGSQRRLDLQLFWITGTSARRSLDVWPALPLLIQGGVPETSINNVISALEYSDRVCKIDLKCCTTSQDEKLWTAMQVPFPELAVLRLLFGGKSRSHVPVLPDSFLGGSAPRLRYLALAAISFPGLPKLLLSATRLVHLRLHLIPDSGYISPKAMATSLSMLTNLEELHFEFHSPQSPDQESRRSPPPTRSFLPALTKFSFKGVKEYLEDLVSQVDAPRLHRFSTTFFDDVDFHTPELKQFISRTSGFRAHDEAVLIVYNDEAQVRLQSHPGPSDHGMVEVKILCRGLNRQLSFLAQICTLSLRLLLTMENLYIDEFVVINPYIMVWSHDIQVEENTEWLDLLRPFTAVKNLYLAEALLPRIAPALRELTGGRTTEVLPALQNVLLEEGFQPSESVQDSIAQFVSARQLANQPITVSVWDKDWLSGQ